jgi:hypothetical protein
MRRPLGDGGRAAAQDLHGPVIQGDAYADLGEVLLLAGKPEDAAAALGQALERYELKENLVMAGRTRDRLTALALTS